MSTSPRGQRIAEYERASRGQNPKEHQGAARDPKVLDAHSRRASANSQMAQRALGKAPAEMPSGNNKSLPRVHDTNAGTRDADDPVQKARMNSNSNASVFMPGVRRTVGGL
jgi:hypothetical protein